MYYLLRRAAMTLVCLVIALGSNPALAAYSPTTPPPGWTGTASAWKELHDRGAAFAEFVSKFAKGSDPNCLKGVLIRNLIQAEIRLARDKNPPENSIKNTDASNASKLRHHADRERDDACRPPNGGNPLANMDALATLGHRVDDWSTAGFDSEDLARYSSADVKESTEYLYGLAKPSSPTVLDLLKAGVLVPALQGAGRLAGLTLPILNPELFTPNRQREQSL
jgi:hypothetical protein